MPNPQFDRERLSIRPLRERRNQVRIARDLVSLDYRPRALSPRAIRVIREATARIRVARRNGRSVMLAFGAHAIKNGLGPVIARLIEDGWVTHLATNGAGIIHDWEIAYQGATGEDVRSYVRQGQFGMWQETGSRINLAITVGAYEGLGYGESVGAMIANDGLMIPGVAELKRAVLDNLDRNPDRSAAAADLLETVTRFSLAKGAMRFKHRFKRHSVQNAAYGLKVPFTGHPMIGQDIIYNHPMNHGAAIGRTGLRDFLCFADSASRLDGGVYMSLGSAVMSPMVFEKAFAMCQNIRAQKGAPIDSQYILVVDLAKVPANWQGSTEPSPRDHAYYLRYLKTFGRMGGTMRYISADNRDFLSSLSRSLRE